MAKSINHYFPLFSSLKEARPSGKLWYPAADVYQTPDGWLVKVELAGVSSEDIEIDIRESILHITGCRYDKTCEAAGFSYQQMEITYSHFEKTLKFPSSIASAELEHNYQDGLLVIYLKTD